MTAPNGETDQGLRRGVHVHNLTSGLQLPLTSSPFLLEGSIVTNIVGRLGVLREHLTGGSQSRVRWGWISFLEDAVEHETPGQEMYFRCCGCSFLLGDLAFVDSAPCQVWAGGGAWVGISCKARFGACVGVSNPGRRDEFGGSIVWTSWVGGLGAPGGANL